MFYFVVVSVGIGCVNVPYCLGFRDISAISINVLNSAVVGGILGPFSLFMLTVFLMFFGNGSIWQPMLAVIRCPCVVEIIGYHSDGRQVCRPRPPVYSNNDFCCAFLI